MTLLLALLLTTASATRIEMRTVPCPLGGEPTKTHHMVSQDGIGGWDSDGARYATRGQYRQFAIATCPDSYVSLFASDMERPLTEAEQHALAQLAETFRAEIDDPDALAVWDRYALAARTYRALGKDRWYLAKLYLQASWTVRDSAVGFYAGLQGPAPTRKLIEAGRVELAKELPDADRKAVLFNLAKVARRGGYLADQAAFTAALQGLSATFTEAERAALADLDRASRLEPRFQDLAITELEGVLTEATVSTAVRAEATYLLADLYRRRGRDRDAQPLFQEVIDDPATPEPLREPASFLAAELRGERPWETTTAK